MSELSMSMFVSKDDLHEARIAEAVAAERARAAQAVREIVGRVDAVAANFALRKDDAGVIAHRMRIAARECLAAVEGKR